ncbi:hypothetical protein F5888DRAFT_1632943 [Russula emetica]|nr:hypothetical protein F5888DRAFT_1632943 [Russula emetica]
MHPSKLIQSDESMRASVHILHLLINDPLVQSLLPKGPPSNTAPAKELNALQIRLTSLENTLANLAKATTEVRKEIKHQPTNTSNTARTPTSRKPPSSQPTYAAKAATPQHPSAIMGTAAYTWPDDHRPTPADICVTINNSLDRSNTTQVRISAARWTAKGNLVIWGGANTTAPQLSTILPQVAEILAVPFAALSQSSPSSPRPLRPNVKWSKLHLNAIFTGVTPNRGAYTPDECHAALVAENPSYAALTITQKPSWVRDPITYQQGAVSSLSVSFEDPDGTGAQTLLRHSTLFAFGHVVTVKCWKQTPPKRVPGNSATSITNPITLGVNAPVEEGSQPSVYQPFQADPNQPPARLVFWRLQELS